MQGFITITLLILLGFIFFCIYFIFKQLQFVIQSVNLYKKMIDRQDMMIKLLGDIKSGGGVTVNVDGNKPTRQTNTAAAPSVTAPEPREATRDDLKLIKEAKEGNIDEVTSLLNSGSYINAQDKIGMTALHRAAKEGDTQMVKLLIEKGADTSIKNNMDKTAQEWASEKGEDEVVKILQQYAVTT